MEWLQAHMGSVGTALAGICTMFGEELILIAVVGFLYWCYDKEYGKFVGTNLVFAVVLNPLIKNIFLRRRPYFDHEGIRCLKPVDADAAIDDLAAQGYSFPSGHSMSAAGTYGSLAAYRKNRWTLAAAILIPLLVGVSRFCLGVHYPTDVLVGWLCGFLVIALIGFMQVKVRDRRKLYLILALAGLPGYFYCKSDDYFTAYGMMLGVFCGILFEERYVHFANTRNPMLCILRIAGGLAVFLVLNMLLKLLFSGEFLGNGSLAAHLVRSCRYGVACFVVIGVYPMLFKAEEKIRVKKQ